MNSLGVKMASPGVLWEWHRTLAGVTGSQGFSNSHLPSSERFFPRGILLEKTIYFLHLRGFLQCLGLYLQNCSEISSLLPLPPSVSDPSLTISQLKYCIQSDWHPSFCPWCPLKPEQVSLLGTIWWLSISLRVGKKKKTLYWSKSPNQSIKFSLCLLISLGSSLWLAPTAFLLFPQQMPVPRIPDHFLFKPYSVVFIFTGHKGSKTWRSWF